MISRNHALGAVSLVLLTLAILFLMGRPLICECGTVELWHGEVQSAGNSQHLSDWYTFSHIIHGFLFYGLGHILFRKGRKARRIGLSLCLAIFLEGAWEIVENSPMIIERYREATFAFGYAGDSIINSMADIGWMTLGFFAAWRLPVKWTVAIAVIFELLTLYTIRDNLTLNVLMLTYPIEAVKEWQGAAGTG